MKGKIVLENGEVLEGCQYRGSGERRIGKIIFDTRIVGYEKILTCPEYKDKIVVFSYPLIGNYGINYEDMETDNRFPAGLVVSELSSVHSNYRADLGLPDFIREINIPLIEGADTQYLTRTIRDNKDLWAAMVFSDSDMEDIPGKIKQAKESAGQESFSFPPFKEELQGGAASGQASVAVLNLGVKKSEISWLKSPGFRLNIISPNSKNADETISSSNALYITSGSYNKETLNKTVCLIKKHLGKIPVFAAGLGHLAAGEILGGRVSDNQVNHYGINLPVVNVNTGKHFITEQSHSFTLKPESLPRDSVIYKHLNDSTIEGLYEEKLKIFSVSFHPQQEHFQSFFSMIKE